MKHHTKRYVKQYLKKKNNLTKIACNGKLSSIERKVSFST